MKLWCFWLQYQFRCNLYSMAMAAMQTLYETFLRRSTDFGGPLHCKFRNMTLWQRWPCHTETMLEACPNDISAA